MATQPITDTQRIAATVSELLRERDITPEAAADLTAIPYRTLARRLTGLGKAFDVNELAALARILDVTLTDLFNRAESETAA